MAGVAIYRGVRADERKAILMVLNRLRRNIPPLNGMALLAVRSHLPPVNVGVAVRALGADIREHQLDVALGALHLLVHSAQRVTGLVVIELRDAPDRLPAGVGVAVFAGNADIAVRILGGRSLRRSSTWSLREGNTRGEREQKNELSSYSTGREPRHRVFVSDSWY